jgi:S1-C subfamily serine protease/antitoxin component YwqK of YwqJK toxin-antitoxin module
MLLSMAFVSGWADNYTLCEHWVDCGNSCQLLDPYYTEGVSFTWSGSVTNGKANGQGTAKKFVNGELESTYVGEYKNGIRAGKGTFTHKDGSVKKGVFVNGQLCGLGTMEAENGDSYQGEYVNYRMHGRGKYHYGNGATFEGFYVSDTPYTGKFTNYDGSIYYIQEGELVDKIEENHSNYTPKIGTRVTEYFNSDWKHCQAKDASYYRIITYSAPHTPKGVVKDYYMSGALQGEATFVYVDYEDDAKNFNEGEMTLYYESGKVQSHVFYINNQPNGPQIDYYESGQKKSESFYTYGLLNGTQVTYFENGNPYIIANYELGRLKNNKFLEFSEDGESCALAYNEDFQKNSNSWKYEGANGKLEVTSSNTIGVTVSPERSVSGGIYVDFSSSKDNIIELTTRQNSVSKDVVVGFLFGFKDWDNYCGFYINGNQYLIQQVRNGKQISDHSWQYSEAIKTDINSISIANIGDKLSFQINDEKIGYINRPRYDGAYFCLTVVNTGYTTVNVDAGGLSIYEIVNDLNAVKEYLPQSQSNADGGWKGSGSGFFIDERGYMATNYHVVDGAKSIEVTFIRNGETESYPASVVLSDKQNDLSILKVESSSFKQLAPIPYNFSTRIKDTGSEVFTLGYPIADVMGEEVKFTDGKISSKTGIQGDVTVYQISVPIQPGNSGGPLFDNLGNIVGITSSGLNREYFKSENVNYAIKSSYLSSLVDALPQTIHLRTDAQIADKPLTEKIKLFQDYMIYIKVK